MSSSHSSCSTADMRVSVVIFKSILLCIGRRRHTRPVHNAPCCSCWSIVGAVWAWAPQTFMTIISEERKGIVGLECRSVFSCLLSEPDVFSQRSPLRGRLQTPRLGGGACSWKGEWGAPVLRSWPAAGKRRKECLEPNKEVDQEEADRWRWEELSPPHPTWEQLEETWLPADTQKNLSRARRSSNRSSCCDGNAGKIWDVGSAAPLPLWWHWGIQQDPVWTRTRSWGPGLGRVQRFTGAQSSSCGWRRFTDLLAKKSVCFHQNL